jgi:hypothetical protein
MTDTNIYFGGGIGWGIEHSSMARNGHLPGYTNSTDPDDITLENLKFISTHNSIICDKQFGGRMSYDTFVEMIDLLKFMPLCLELDLSFLSGKNIGDSRDVHEVFLDHFTQQGDVHELGKKPHIITATKSKMRKRSSSFLDFAFGTVTSKSKTTKTTNSTNSTLPTRFGSDSSIGTSRMDDIDHYVCYNKEFHDELKKHYSIKKVFENIKLLLEKTYTTAKERDNLFPIVLTIDATQLKKATSDSTELKVIEKKVTHLIQQCYSDVFGERDTSKASFYLGLGTLNIHTIKLRDIRGKLLLRHTKIAGLPSPHILKAEGASTEIYLNKSSKIDEACKPTEINPKQHLSRLFPSFFTWGKDKWYRSLANEGKLKSKSVYDTIKMPICYSLTTDGMSSSISSSKEFLGLGKDKTPPKKCHLLRLKGECLPYLTLNKLLAEMVFGKNNYNFVAFNWHDLKLHYPDLITRIVNAFKKLYKVNPTHSNSSRKVSTISITRPTNTLPIAEAEAEEESTIEDVDYISHNSSDNTPRPSPRPSSRRLVLAMGRTRKKKKKQNTRKKKKRTTRTKKKRTTLIKTLMDTIKKIVVTKKT